MKSGCFYLFKISKLSFFANKYASRTATQYFLYRRSLLRTHERVRNRNLRDIQCPISLWLATCMMTHLYPDALLTPSFTVLFFDSEMHAPFLDGPLCACGLVGDDARIFSLISAFGTLLSLCLGVFLGSYLISVVNHVLPNRNLIIKFVLLGLLILFYPPARPYHCVPNFCI